MVHDIENMSEKFWSRLTTFRESHILGSYWPFITQICFCYVYGVHGTQNDRLELTVSMQELVLKNMQ